MDEKEERTKTSTNKKNVTKDQEDKISESKIDKTTDKEKEFLAKES